MSCHSDDSLADFQQAADFGKIEREFQTNKPYEDSSLEKSGFKASCKLSYSSDKKDSIKPRYQTFGNEAVYDLHTGFKRALDLIRSYQYEDANIILREIKSQQFIKKIIFTPFDEVYYTYLQVCIYFALEIYDKFYEEVPKVIDNEFVDFKIHALNMLVEALIKEKQNYKGALPYQLQLIEEIEQNQNSFPISKEQQHLQLADIYYHLNLLEEAYVIYYKFNQVQQALELSFKLNKLDDFLKFAQVYESDDEQEMIVLKNRMSKIHYERRQFSNSLECMNQVVTLLINTKGLQNMETCNALMNLGRLMMMKCQHKEAQQKFKLAGQIVGQLQGCRSLLFGQCGQLEAQCLFGLGEYEKAYQIYMEIADLFVGESGQRIQVNIINLLLRSNQLREVQERIQGLVDNPNGGILYELGSLLLKHQQRELACEILEFALEHCQEGQRMEIALKLGDTLSDCNDYNGSLSMFKQLLDGCNEAKQKAAIYRKMGLVYRKCGRHKDFVHNFQKGIEVLRENDLKELCCEYQKEFKQLKQN